MLVVASSVASIATTGGRGRKRFKLKSVVTWLERNGNFLAQNHVAHPSTCFLARWHYCMGMCLEVQGCCACCREQTFLLLTRRRCRFERTTRLTNLLQRKSGAKISPLNYNGGCRSDDRCILVLLALWGLHRSGGGRYETWHDFVVLPHRRNVQMNKQFMWIPRVFCYFA